MNPGRYFLLTVILLGLFFSSYAQHKHKEDKDILLDFVTVSNAYKKMPLYLEVELKNSTNFITTETDTATLEAKFFLREHGSYVKFGEFEQLVNDSMALLVSNQLQQMILYSDVAPVISQLKNMMGAPLPDSSMKKMAEKYTATAKKISGNNTEIDLLSVDMLYNTSLPKEMIEMQYDNKTKFPKQVITVRRSLVPLDSSLYEYLSSDKKLVENIITLKDKGHFLVKEQKMIFIYKSLDQNDKQKMPALVSDRIEKTGDGEYKPVKSYENYLLTINH